MEALFFFFFLSTTADFIMLKLQHTLPVLPAAAG